LILAGGVATLIAIPRGFEAEVFTGWMPFLSPKQQHQNTEGNIM